MNNIEEFRNKLNVEIRGILAIMDLIDGSVSEHASYNSSLTEEEYLIEQIKLISEAKQRLINIFKD